MICLGVLTYNVYSFKLSSKVLIMYICFVLGLMFIMHGFYS